MKGGPEGIRALTTTKAIVEDRFGWAIQTTIPKQLDYPVASIKESWCVQRCLRPSHSLIRPCREFVSGLIGFIYGDSWRTRIDSLTQLIQASRR